MKAKTQPPLIPSYNLYGEIGDLPDIVHCESIVSRSSLHGWHINAHRHNRLHQFFLVRTGGGTCHLDGRGFNLAPPQILTVPPRTVHGFEFLADTEGWVLTIPLEVMDEALSAGHDLRLLLASANRLKADPAIMALFDEMAHEHGGHRFARAHVIRAIIRLIIGKVSRALAETRHNENARAGSPLLHRFELLLEEHYKDHWSLTDYAKKLATTPTHLSRLAKSSVGVPASKLVEDRLIREARRSLVYTRMSVAEIAYSLGFTDPAYFSRVFTRATGMAPRVFRSQIEFGSRVKT